MIQFKKTSRTTNNIQEPRFHYNNNNNKVTYDGICYQVYLKKILNK